MNIRQLVTLLILSSAVFAQTRQLPSFDDYPVPLYRGRTLVPKWMMDVDGSWRDERGKLVDPPEINFAGRYLLVAHGCGTSCRYYTLTDLVTRRDIEDVIDVFSSGEPMPKTSDGFPYLSELRARPNSNLLIVQYQLETPDGRKCRERSFVFHKLKLQAITGTSRSCREIQ